MLLSLFDLAMELYRSLLTTETFSIRFTLVLSQFLFIQNLLARDVFGKFIILAYTQIYCIISFYIILGDKTETNQRFKYVGLLGLFTMYFNIYQTLDKKFFKQLWDVNKKVPAIYLSGNILLMADEFLLDHIPHCEKFMDKKQIDAAVNSRYTFLTANTSNLTKWVGKRALISDIYCGTLLTYEFQYVCFQLGVKHLFLILILMGPLTQKTK